MHDNESIKNELQTLIMLEQQQAGALQQLNNKSTFPGGGIMGGFMGGNMFSSLYGASTYDMTTRANGDFYDRAVNGVISSVNNVNASMRHAALAANLDSSSPLWRNQSKMSMEARELYGSRLGEKMTGGAVSALSTGASLLTGMGGFVSGIAGGAAVGVAATIASDQLKQNFAYDQYLLQNSYRFINMYESNNKRGVGGFNRNERWGTANWLRHFNTEMRISDEDTMTILKGFTEGDLLREADSVDTFKKQMTSLTKTLKTMALTLNESYEEVADLMAEMKKKGIDTRNYQAFASSAKITGGLIGAEASEVLQYQMNTASALTRGTSLDTDRMMGTVDSAQAYIGKMRDDALKIKDTDSNARDRYNRIINRGDVDGATSDYLNLTSQVMRSQNVTSSFASAFFDWNGSSWEFNRKKFEDISNGKYTLQEIGQMASQNLNSSGKAAIAAWQSNGAYYLENNLSSVVDRAMLMKMYTDAARRSNSSTAGFNDSEILSAALGLMSGDDALFAADITNSIVSDGGAYYNKMKSASVAEGFIQRANANRMGIGYAFKNWWGGVTDEFGDFFSPIGKGFANAGEWIQDKWYGKNYYDVKGLWSDIDYVNDSFDAEEIKKKIDLLGEAAEQLGEKSSKAAKLMNSAQAYYQNILDSVGTETSGGSGLHSKLGSALTNYDSWENNWESEYGSKYGFWDHVLGNAGAAERGQYRKDAATYFNDVLKMGISVDGRMTLEQEQQIMDRARTYMLDLANGDEKLDFEQRRMVSTWRNYLNITGENDPTITSSARGIRRNKTSKVDAFADNGLSGLTGDEKVDKLLLDYSPEELQNMLKAAEDKLNQAEDNIESSLSVKMVSWMPGVKTALNNALDNAQTEYDAINTAVGIALPTVQDIEGKSKMYGAFAKLIGGDDKMAQYAENTVRNNMYSGARDIKDFFIDEIFTSLGENGATNWSAGSVIDLNQFKSDLMNSAHLQRAGLTSTDINQTVEHWANQEGKEIKTGDVLSQDNLRELIGTFMGVLAGNGLTDQTDVARDEQKARDNIEDIATMLREYLSKKGINETDKDFAKRLGLNYYEREYTPKPDQNQNGGTPSAGGSGHITYE